MMSEPTKKGLVPVLRFPEFRDAGKWEIFPLSNYVATLDAGVSVNSGDRPATSGEFGILKTSAVTNGVFEPSENKVVLEANEIERLKEPVCEDSIIISRMNTPTLVGANAYVEASLKNVFLPDRLWAAKPKEGTSMRFIAFILGSGKTRAALSELGTGTSGSMKNITKTDVLSLKIAAPKFPEQQKIADCLSSIDELVTAQTQKVEALKAHKKSLMQQLFPAESETIPKLRFLEFSGEWKLKKIGDFIESYKGGAALTPSDFSSFSDCQVIPKKAITEGGWLKIDNEKPTYCNEEFYKNNLQSVVDSSYLITTLRDLVPSDPSIGYIVKYVDNINYILAQGVYGLKPKKTFISDFLIHFSNSDIYRKMMQSVMVGSTQVHIRNSTYLGLPICVPSLEEQQKIANCLTSIEDLITTQTQKLAALKAHKKGLMQQLFPSCEEVAE